MGTSDFQIKKAPRPAADLVAATAGAIEMKRAADLFIYAKKPTAHLHGGPCSNCCCLFGLLIYAKLVCQPCWEANLASLHSTSVRRWLALFLWLVALVHIHPLPFR
jgi:hypothetical protein